MVSSSLRIRIFALFGLSLGDHNRLLFGHLGSRGCDHCVSTVVMGRGWFSNCGNALAAAEDFHAADAVSDSSMAAYNGRLCRQSAPVGPRSNAWIGAHEA
jgi:hypothetical protein